MGLLDRIKEQALGPRLAALLKVDDDAELDPEAFLVRLVDAIHKDEPRMLSDEDIEKAAKKRQRLAGLAGAAGGPAGLYIAGLYSEAAVVCDVVDRHHLGLTDDRIAAHLLLLWGAAKDLPEAQAAIDGTGRSTRELMADRLHEQVSEIKTKRQAVMALWRLRKGIADRDVPGALGPRDVLLPGKRVRAVIREAEAQLGVA